MRIQDRLFTIGSILATDPEKATIEKWKRKTQLFRRYEMRILNSWRRRLTV